MSKYAVVNIGALQEKVSIGDELVVSSSFSETTLIPILVSPKKGQIVSEGQVVGKMGRTGRVDGAHLHYEISVNGKSKDPAIYFSIGRKLLSRNSLKSIADIN